MHTFMRSALEYALLLAGLFVISRPAPGLSQAPRLAGVADTAKIGLIRQVIAATRAADQAVLAMETGLPAQRASNPRIPAVFWDRFVARARTRRSEFVELLVPIYDQRFSPAELRDLLAFYQSPLGLRLLEVQPDLTRDAMLAGQKWGMRLGTEIGQELAAEGIQIQP
jgi:uncharacterized protein